MSANGLAKLTASRNELQEKLNNPNLDNRSDTSILSQIDAWEQNTIQKVQQAANEVRKEVSTLIKFKQEELKKQFQTFSKELDNLQETKTALDQDLTRLEREIVRINEDLKRSFQPSTVTLVTNNSEQIAWKEMIYVEKRSENGANHHESRPISPDTQQFAAPGVFPEQYCEGRHCAKCGKCRDWYFTGDLDTWAWIRNCKNWTDTDASRWRKNHYFEQFESRAGERCIFDHGFGLPGLPPGPHQDHRLFGLHICLCEDNTKSHI